MRFGIMAMQLNELIPPGKPPEQIMASLMDFDHAGLIRRLHERGFNPIELGGDLGMFLPPSYQPKTIEALAALKKETGVSYTLHLPLWSVEPSTPLTPVRHGSAQAVIDVLNATLPLDIESYVLHATGALAAEFYQMRLPDAGKALILRMFQAGARETIQTILKETGIPGRKLSIETVEFPFELTLELAEEMDTSMCLDTGHVLVGFSGPVELFDVLEKVLPRLGEIHLHDGPWQGPERKIGYGKDHSPLGTGDLDVGRLLDRLEAAHWNGPIIFELKVEEALASLDYVRKLRPGALG
ncbi:MAG TPA: cobamide remodeling phosphodiesterase CbiR [Longilinea sp.]|nr:cobamide remodeling phosphodiesterase CbiR [Longilinea sp.]